MTVSLRIGLLLAAAAGSLVVFWLAADAVHALRIRGRLARAPVRIPAEPFILNPAGAPALLLIHGFADGPAVFAQLAPPLADAGFAVRRGESFPGLGPTWIRVRVPEPAVADAFAAALATLRRT